MIYAIYFCQSHITRPHALFLGSSLATADRVSVGIKLPAPTSAQSKAQTFKYIIKAFFGVSNEPDVNGQDRTTKHGLRENNSFEFVKAHLTHAVVDLGMSKRDRSQVKTLICAVASLMGLAMLINSASVLSAGEALAYSAVINSR